MTTAADIIKLALKDLGPLGVGQAASAEDTNDALVTLNMMLSTWQGERLMVYHLVDTAIRSTGAQSYSVGLGGDFNIQRPIKINAAYARLDNTGSNAVDYTLKIIEAREDYARISVKSLASFPDFLFYDSAFPLGNLIYYPVPNSSFMLHILTQEVLGQFAAPATVINLPPEYMAAIRYNLAVWLAGSYQLDAPVGIQRLASHTRRVVKRMNNQILQLTMPAGLGSKSKYNIFSDTSYS